MLKRDGKSILFGLKRKESANYTQCVAAGVRRNASLKGLMTAVLSPLGELAHRAVRWPDL